MNGIYQDGTYLENNPLWHREDSLWKAEQIKKIIDRNYLSPTSICEIGCGAGEILYQLSKSFDSERKYFGYEISRQAFDLCKIHSKPNLKFFLKNLLAERDTHFDLVLAIDVIEHVEDYFGFLRKLRDKAKFKIFHIPLDLSVQTVLRINPILKRRKTVGHLHYFTKETALETLRDTGYEVIDFFYTATSLELSNLSWKANFMKMPRRVSFLINKDLTARILGGYSILILAK